MKKAKCFKKNAFKAIGILHISYLKRFLSNNNSLTLCFSVGQRENCYSPVHHEGWMVSGPETVFCWIPGPQLTTVVAVSTTYKITNNNPQEGCQ
jgi:hypothetical protein